MLKITVVATFAFYEKYFHVYARPVIRLAMWDGTLAGAAAHRAALPGVLYGRCLPHQIRRAKTEVPQKCTGDAELQGVCTWLVVGSLVFSAFRLWTLECFSEHWDEVSARLIADGQLALVSYVREWILFWDDRYQCWNAHWYSAGGSDKLPGESSYLQQAWERNWGVLEEILPRSICHMEPTTAVRKLALATETLAKARGWVLPAQGSSTHEKWSFVDDFEKRIRPEGIPPRYVNGERLLTEHLPTEDEEQWAIPTFHRLAEYLPSNQQMLECSGCTHNGAPVTALYVMPCFHADLRITEDLARAVKTILFAQDKRARRQAKKDVGVYVEENGHTRYTMRGARLFFLGVAPCLVLQDGSIICFCEDFMVRKECGHAYYVQYLRLERRYDEFPTMNSLTQSTKRSSGGRRVERPTKAAQLTLEDIREAAAKRRAQRDAKKGTGDRTRKRFLRQAFSSPSRDAAERRAKEKEVEGNARANTLKDVAESLQAEDAMRRQKALYRLFDARVDTKEAQDSEHRLGNKCLKIKMDESELPSSRALATLLLKGG